MLIVSRSEDQELLTTLKKQTFNPTKAVQLLQSSLEAFSSGKIAESTKSSFITNLSIFTEKLLKRKYSKYPLETSTTVFEFLLQLMAFCQRDLEILPIEKLSVVNSILDSSNTFYKKAKNSYSQNEEFKERVRKEVGLETTFFGYNEVVNDYYVYVLSVFLKSQGDWDFSKVVGTKILFDTILATCDLYKPLKPFLSTSQFQTLCSNFLTSIISLLSSLKDNDLRFINKESLKTFYTRLEDFSKLSQPLDQLSKTIETLELEVSFNLLECQLLDKKFIGVDELTRITRQIKKREELRSNQTFSIGEKASKYLTSDLFAEWANSKRLLQSLYSGSSHVEVIKKFTEVLKFLYSKGHVGQEIIAVIWDSGFCKHQTEKDEHLNVIHELMWSLTADDLKFVRSRLQALDVRVIDLQVLKIMKQFNLLNHKLGPGLLGPSETAEETFPHLQILWRLAQERALQEGVSRDIHLKAITYLSDCLRQSNLKNFRLEYVEKCIGVLGDVENAACVIEILKSVLDTYAIIEIKDSETRVQVVARFEKQILTAILKNITNGKVKLLKKFPQVGALEEFSDKAGKVFTFFKYLIRTQPAILTVSKTQKLWNLLVVNRICNEESDVFFEFLSSLVSDVPVLKEKQIVEIYTEFLLRLNPKMMTKTSFKCFERYFLKINKIYNRVVVDNSDFLISVMKKDLISLEHLWRLVLTCTNEVVFDESAFLLKRIHRNFQNFSIGDQKEFVSKCFEYLQAASEQRSEENSSKILRCVQMILDFFKYCENTIQATHFQTQQQTIELKVSIKYFFYKKNSQGTIYEDFYNTTQWSSAKELIAQRLNKDLNYLSFSVDGKVIWGDNSKTLEDLNVDKFLEIEVSENENGSSFDEHFAQLKNIFEYLEDEVIRLALQREGNSLDEAVNLLTNEDMVATLRSEACDKNLQVAVIETGDPKEAPKNKPELLRFVAQNQAFCKALERLAELNDTRILQKAVELFSKLPFNKALKNSIKNFANIGPDEIINTRNRLKLWRSLKIILKLLEKQKTTQWMETFFEYGGFLLVTEMLCNYESHGLKPSDFLSTEILCSQIDILIFYIKKFFANSNFTLEEIINLHDITQALLQILSTVVSSPQISENILESALSLLITLAAHDSSLLTSIYKDNIFQILSLQVLPNSHSSTLRCKIVDTIRTLVLTLGPNCSQYFWDLLSAGIPTTQSPQCKEFFITLSMILETCPIISEEFINNCTLFIIHRKIDESLFEDFLLSGYLDLTSKLFQNRNTEHERNLLSFVYFALFELNSFNDFGKDSESLPLIKKSATRRSALRLLSLLIKKFQEESFGIRNKIAEHHPVGKLSRVYNRENEAKAACGFVGLRNFGCTCYLNSALQQLFMIQKFQEGILDAELVSAENKEDNILYQMQVLVANLKYSEKQCFEPGEFCRAFKDFEGQSINVRVQQDADEFLNLLFDKIEENLKLTKKNFLPKIIGGTLIHEIASTEPEFPYKGTRLEHFFRISLDIRNLKNLSAALDQYIRAEVLEGDNKYLCEEFNTKVNATKRCLLGSLCNTIFIHLKRFEFKYQEMKREKINDKFEFPVELNLRNWCSDDSSPEVYYEYELAGVVIHSGNADSGHYYSLIKDRKSLNWFKFDDRYVQVYDFSQLHKDCFGQDQMFSSGFEFESMSNAYILVYERKTFLAVETEMESEGVSLRGDIVRQVVEENIDFLQDLMYFEESYEEFLVDLVQSEGLDGSEEYECEFLTGRVAEFEVVREIKFAGELKEVMSGMMTEIKKDGIGTKMVKAAFVFALELLIKAEKPEWFRRISGLIFEKIKKNVTLAFWVLDLFNFNRTLMFVLMNSIKVDDVKSTIMSFLLDCLKIALSAQQQILFHKQLYIHSQIDSTNDFRPIFEVTEEIYKATSSRFADYLLNYGLNCFKALYNIEELLLIAIEELSSTPQFSELLLTNSAISFLLNLYNAPTTKDLGKIHFAIQNLLRIIKLNPSFDLSLCKDINIIQSYRFSDFLLRNIEYYKEFLQTLVKKNAKIAELIIEGLCEEFLRKTALVDRWNALGLIEEVLLGDPESKVSNLRTFFGLRFGRFNKGMFFDEIFMGFEYSQVVKVLVVIWWGNMMRDEDGRRVSGEFRKAFFGFGNARMEGFMISQLEGIGIKEPDKRFEESQKLVNLLSI